jgi:hypothetical protein
MSTVPLVHTCRFRAMTTVFKPWPGGKPRFEF